MSKFFSALTGAVLAASFSLPLSATPIYVPQPAQVQTDAVDQVNHRRSLPIPMKPPLCSEMIAPPVSGMISPPV